MEKRMDKVKNRVKALESSMQSIVEQSFNILKANENIKRFINYIDNQSISKEEDPSTRNIKDRTLDESSRKWKRSNTRK